MQGWQPISEAPKPEMAPYVSGPRVLLALKHGSVMIGCYSYTRTGVGRWRDDHCQVLREPTHFQLLPEPPVIPKED